jgi:hypothetical protein
VYPVIYLPTGPHRVIHKFPLHISAPDHRKKCAHEQSDSSKIEFINVFGAYIEGSERSHLSQALNSYLRTNLRFSSDQPCPS